MYLLDANFFIQSKRLYYQREVHAGFWQWVEREIERGNFRSIARVYNPELTDGEDWLVDWATDQGDQLFLADDDEDTQRRYAEVVQHAESLDKTRPAKDNFLSKADPWLIAKARTIPDCTVVTYEVINRLPSKLPIPEVCDHFAVRCISPYELQTETGIRFGIQLG